MLKKIASQLKKDWGLSDSLLTLAVDVESLTAKQEETASVVAYKNFLKVLEAFRTTGIQETYLHPSYGYGYWDSGREALETLFAKVFRAEEALVRPQLITGTHAIRCALFGVARPGDKILVIPKTPYDTLASLFGFTRTSGSLPEWGISVKTASPEEFLSTTPQAIQDQKVLFLQRSKGYAWQESLSLEKLVALIHYAKKTHPEMIVIVDNCYGEFVEEKEPLEIGADLIVGSLMKNPGGGLAGTGGYVAGKKEEVEKATFALTAPGLGKEVGPTAGLTRDFFRGLFLAPQFVGEAMKVSVFASRLFQALGYPVNPAPDEFRTDIIQGIQLESLEKLLAFSRGIQKAGPLHANAIPEPVPMAGYQNAILMAGGTFIQGGSLELSCDAPLRPPYSVYVQGGLSAVHGKLGLLLAAAEVIRRQGKGAS